jgi:hypothetical protein
MLSWQQFKFLKTLCREPKTGDALTVEDRKKAQYFMDIGYCTQVFPRVEGVLTAHYTYTEKGKSAIAEHRLNRLRLLPPWFSLLLSIAALVISVWF